VLPRDLSPASPFPPLMKLVADGRLDPTVFATHRFALEDTMSAYDSFADAASTAALKVVFKEARSTAARGACHRGSRASTNCELSRVRSRPPSAR
jgi:hypothetical protein